MNKENSGEKLEQWGDEAKKNPSQMIRKLQNIKCENEKKFKLLDLGISMNSSIF